MAAREVCVGVQVRLDILNLVADPPNKAIIGAGFQVADESVEFAVARRSPLGDARGKRANCTLEIESCNSRGIEDLHENTNSPVGKLTLSRGLIGRTMEERFAHLGRNTVWTATTPREIVFRETADTPWAL